MKNVKVIGSVCFVGGVIIGLALSWIISDEIAFPRVWFYIDYVIDRVLGLFSRTFMEGGWPLAVFLVVWMLRRGINKILMESNFDIETPFGKAKVTKEPEDVATLEREGEKEKEVFSIPKTR